MAQTSRPSCVAGVGKDLLAVPICCAIRNSAAEFLVALHPSARTRSGEELQARR